MTTFEYIGLKMYIIESDISCFFLPFQMWLIKNLTSCVAYFVFLLDRVGLTITEVWVVFYFFKAVF